MQRSRLILLLAATLALQSGNAGAASVSKSYSYFSVGGATIAEIEAELSRRGPHVESTGKRHPGATTMQFKTKLGFAEGRGRCRIASADVSVRARVTLPSWKRPRKAENATRLIWDTLAADIKRHEESHIGIAKNAARDMETSMLALGSFPDCRAAGARAQDVFQKRLARHDEEQSRFDRIEGKNFESRIMRLLQYRLERIKAAGG
jgi:predicted secreted Zn-dependent protease